MEDSDQTVQVQTRLLRLVDASKAQEERRRSPCLIAVAGPHRGAIYTLRDDEVVLGRMTGIGVPLNDVGISRRHAVIHVNGGGSLILRDLGSRNGTLVNGHRVETVDLNDGDVIELGESTKLVVTWADPAQEMILRKQYDMATRDALTGCYRNHYFLEQLQREWTQAQRTNMPLSVLFIDVDFFKHVNDSHGHAVGDEVLQQLGAFLINAARKSDVVCRYGGEEFVVMLPHTDNTTASVVAERWREAFAGTPMATKAGPLHVTLSIGVSTNNEPKISTIHELMRLADERLYQAKHHGRNRVEGAPAKIAGRMG